MVEKLGTYHVTEIFIPQLTSQDQKENFITIRQDRVLIVIKCSRSKLLWAIRRGSTVLILRQKSNYHKGSENVQILLDPTFLNRHRIQQ